MQIHSSNPKRMKKDKFYKRLEHVNKKIEQVDKRHTPHRYALLAIIFGVAISSVLFLGLKETGYVTFSEDSMNNIADSFFVKQSGTINVDPPMKNPTSLWLSGEVFGKGTAEVYLVTDDKKYLVYYFEGDAHQGKEFKNMCIETCFSGKVKEGSKLYFKLEGTTLRVDNIKYLSSRIVEFELQPKEMTIDAETQMINIKLTNPYKRDINVFLYVDGPLENSFSWKGSLIHMNPDESQREISVRFDPPSNLEPGEYPNKISARYVPPGDREFVGSAPVDEMIVTVRV